MSTSFSGMNLTAIALSIDLNLRAMPVSWQAIAPEIV